MTLALLATATAPVLAAPPDQDADECNGVVHVVAEDNWLSKIADKYLGDALAYPAIVMETSKKATAAPSFATIGTPI